MENDNKKQKNSFLGVMFNCCNIYGRIYKNKAGTHYCGFCPKCMKQVKIKIGEGGTSERFFNSY